MRLKPSVRGQGNNSYRESSLGGGNVTGMKKKNGKRQRSTRGGGKKRGGGVKGKSEMKNSKGGQGHEGWQLSK